MPNRLPIAMLVNGDLLFHEGLWSHFQGPNPNATDGIARLWDTLEADDIAQTGSYKTEADSTKPLVIDSPTGGGKLGLVTGTVSLTA